MGFALLEHVPGRPRTPITTEQAGDIPGGARIRCPRCGWEPGGDDAWICECGHEWNTFDTRGTCPACRRSYADTQCPRCGEWSPHEDWYAGDDPRQ